MKTRNGFVSNSSSTSFVVIAGSVSNETISKVKEQYGKRHAFVIDANLGQYEFGWDHDEYNDFGSKVLFAYLQARYVLEEHPEWMKMLKDVLQQYLLVDVVEIDLGDEGYVDHQSASSEGQNTEIFDNGDTLIRFLFSTGSYIRTGNDNE